MSSMRALKILLACACILPAASVLGEEPAPKTDTALFEAKIRPVLAAHCYSCHSRDAKELKGKLRLDELSPDFADDATRDRWLLVLKRVKAGEMPPKSQPRPAEKEVQALSDWVNVRVEALAAKHGNQGRVVMRRLNRIEYENTLRDLLGIEIDVKDLLPLDTSAHGFDNIGDALHTSSFLMDCYLEAADAALKIAIPNGPQPPLIKKRYSLKESHQVKLSTESVYRKLDDDTVVCFSSSAWNAVGLSPFYPPDRGKYRFRISASGIQSSDT